MGGQIAQVHPPTYQVSEGHYPIGVKVWVFIVGSVPLSLGISRPMPVTRSGALAWSKCMLSSPKVSKTPLKMGQLCIVIGATSYSAHVYM